MLVGGGGGRQFQKLGKKFQEKKKLVRTYVF